MGTVIEQERVKPRFPHPIPETIRKAWGEEVAADFAAWLAAILKDNLGAIIDSSPHVQVTAAYARRKVNRLTLDRVSYLLLAGKPTLIYADRWYWRVPIDLTFPSLGRVGCVGEIDVDATSGQVEFTDEVLAQVAQTADYLAQKVLESNSTKNTVQVSWNIGQRTLRTPLWL